MAGFDVGSLVSGGLGDVVNAGVGLYEQRRNESFQEEMAKNGIRWRVEDAKAAGLSPLSALGAAGASGSSPSFIGDLGQNIARAGLAGASSDEKAESAMRLKVAEGQLAETDMRTEGLRLQNAKLFQELYGQPGVPSLYGSHGGRGSGLVVPEDMQFGGGLRGAISPEAVKIPSASYSSRAVTAGESPSWQPFRMTDGTTVMLPYAGEGQTFMGQSPVAGTLMAAPQWLWEQIKRIPLGPTWQEQVKGDRALVNRAVGKFGHYRVRNPNYRGDR